MVKIEVQVIDGDNETCEITVKRPKEFKTTTQTERMTATVVSNTINNAINNLKGEL